VIARGVADGVTVMLRGVIDGPDPHRTGGTMSLGRPAAGKTGTTNDSAAVWFCGYTPNLSGCAWVGDPRGGFKYKMSNIVINGKRYTPVYGSSIPGPIWKATMQGALKYTAAKAFDLKPVISTKPTPIASIVCSDSSTICLTPETGTASPETPTR